MSKKIFKLSGLHCNSCSLVIEGELEDIGVEAKVDYARQLAEVVYDPQKVTEKNITEVIEKQGYKVLGVN